MTFDEWFKNSLYNDMSNYKAMLQDAFNAGILASQADKNIDYDLCTICHDVWVDVNNGFDTCSNCLEKI